MRTIITIAGILIIILSFYIYHEESKTKPYGCSDGKRRQGKQEEKTDESNQNK